MTNAPKFTTAHIAAIRTSLTKHADVLRGNYDSRRAAIEADGGGRLYEPAGMVHLRVAQQALENYRDNAWPEPRPLGELLTEGETTQPHGPQPKMSGTLRLTPVPKPDATATQAFEAMTALIDRELEDNARHLAEVDTLTFTPDERANEVMRYVNKARLSSARDTLSKVRTMLAQA